MFLLTHSPILWPMIGFAFSIGYLSGSVPYGLILTKLAGHGDIRKVGSGNIGATNVLRAGGKKLAVITLLLDGLKAAIPVYLAKQIDMDYAIVMAMGAFLGHLFPVWLHFKGGKGVATALGIAFAFAWQLGTALCIVWLLVAVISRYSSLSALLAFAFSPVIATYLTDQDRIPIVMFLLGAVIWMKHKDNLKRLMGGKETKINLKKKT